MNNKQIVQIGDPVLRRVAEPVKVTNFGSKKLLALIADMKEILSKCEDGVALAAPQVGESIRLFIVAEKTFKYTKERVDEHLVYINPKITRRSTKKLILDEGCLSVQGKFGKISRHQKATIEAYDEHGKKFTRGASGLLAEIFQHETDHLDGILFVDSATDVQEIKPKNNELSEAEVAVRQRTSDAK